MEVLDRPDPERLAQLRARDEFFWLDLHGPTPEELEAVGRQLGLPELAIEDSSEMGQRPKLDEYGDTVLLVFYGMSSSAMLAEVHLHLSGSFLVTVRDAASVHLEAARRWATEPDRTEEDVIALVLDTLTDSFAPALDAIEAEVEQLEAALLGRPSVAQRRVLLDRRNDLVGIRQRAIAQRDLLDEGVGVIRRLPGLELDTNRERLRDVHDHLVVVVQRVDVLREALSSALELHLGLVAARQNEVIERLTVVATIFLPLSVVVGFFGMNFGWLVDHIDTWQAFVGYGVGGMMASCAVLAWYVRRLERHD